MTLHITSGECSASALREKLPDADILPFNEAMCEGEYCVPIFGDEFCALRARAYNVPAAEYAKKSPRARLKNISGNDDITLYFDGDMFCAVNAITLLAYLEQSGYLRDVCFHLLKQDGSAEILCSEQLSPRGYYGIYERVFLRRELCKTGFAVFDRVLPLFFDYRTPDNAIMRFARCHADKDAETLLRAMLLAFSDYGLSVQAAEQFLKAACPDKQVHPH